MRKYQPIWEEIKLHHTATLTADVSLHSRIIEAVRKEKKKDLGWKYQMQENRIKYDLLQHIHGNNITFYLNKVNCALYKL